MGEMGSCDNEPHSSYKCRYFANDRGFFLSGQDEGTSNDLSTILPPDLATRVHELLISRGATLLSVIVTGGILQMLVEVPGSIRREIGVNVQNLRTDTNATLDAMDFVLRE